MKCQSYRVSGKKRYSPLCLVFQSACVDFFETCHNCRLNDGKKDECKINAFAMLSNIDNAICVETYFSTKSFSQSRRLLIKKLGWDHRKSRLAPNNATISRWVKEFRDGRLFHRGSRAAADLAEPAPLSPSDRWSGPSGRSGPSVRSPTVLLGGAPDHQGRYPARLVPAGWRHSSYRCCIASLAPGALPWQGHQPEGRGSVGAALARPESARLLPLGLSQRSGL